MGDTNLMPPFRLARIRWKRRLRTWIAICVAYGMLLCTGLLASHVAWTNEDSSLEDDCRSAELSADSCSAEVVELSDKLAGVIHELQIAQSICVQPDWGKLLVLLGSVMDDDVVLSQCTLVTTDSEAAEITSNLKTWLSSSPIETLLATRRYRLKVTGFGRTQSSVSKFVLGLEQVKVFESVRLIKSYRQTFLDGQAIAFSIECWI